MVLAMAAFSIEDTLIKSASASLGIGFILTLFGLGGTVVFVTLARNRGEAVFHPAILSRPVLIRAAFEALARLCFTVAIALTALSNASAILQATPLIVMLGAAFLFGETIGIKRWIAVLVGFIGVLMIIRPGLAGFDSTSLFALAATIGFAGRDLATRAAPPDLSNVQLGVYGFFVLIPTGLLVMIVRGDTVQWEPQSLAYVLAAVIVGVCAYNALTIAMRSGEVSVVSPFRYTRLLFGMAIGVVIFGERPDTMTLLGSLLVVLSGLYTLVAQRNARVSV